MRRTGRSRWRAALVLMAALALIVSACDGEEGTDTTVVDTTEAPTATTAPEPTEPATTAPEEMVSLVVGDILVIQGSFGKFFV